MRYTVTWTVAARDLLAELWLSASDRDAISRAAADIDRNLLLQPWEAGESRAEDLRVLIAPPLGVYYSVSDDDRLVTVKAIWRC
jgi:hypothetical protein